MVINGKLYLHIITKFNKPFNHHYTLIDDLKFGLLEPKKIKFFLHQFRKLDTTKLERRRSLINNFVNAVVLHDDRIDFVFNYQDGTKTVTFEELKEESADSSDLLVSARPC